jgi:hypothetical protein
MAIFAIILIPVFPFILRQRYRHEQKELHEKIEKAAVPPEIRPPIKREFAS